MSVEYIIHVDDKRDDLLSLIVEKIKENQPSSKINNDGPLWVPSNHSEWIDFSIENYESGFFIVSNLNGSDRDKLFSLIFTVFNGLSIKYEIEEI
ncbi:hypothetical protein [Kluyvera intermedia]|uniref:hypothetical protein n=1 Tax=Kluyvera intermedia TaxID=61648 RepID=UPI00370C2493